MAHSLKNKMYVGSQLPAYLRASFHVGVPRTIKLSAIADVQTAVAIDDLYECIQNIENEIRYLEAKLEAGPVILPTSEEIRKYG